MAYTDIVQSMQIETVVAVFHMFRRKGILDDSTLLAIHSSIIGPKQLFCQRVVLLEILANLRLKAKKL